MLAISKQGVGTPLLTENKFRSIRKWPAYLTNVIEYNYQSMILISSLCSYDTGVYHISL